MNVKLRATAWLAFLGPFFFASYGFVNWLASRRAHVGAFVFAWEHRIPFLAWTIIPYWSIDALYVVSLYVCTTKRELDRHALRLLFVQLVCVACFIAFPLRFSFARPEVHGLSGTLFNLLGSFDKPFNQAPSLHIALLVLIWDRLAAHVERRWFLNMWMTLIGVSVLTTYQHHFIDLPTGLAVGLIALWLDEPQLARNPLRWRIAAAYFVAAILLWWTYWLALALFCVGCNYAFLGARGFGKRSDGRMCVPMLILFAPYTLCAWINSRVWTRRCADAGEVVDGVFIGRIPFRRAPFDAIVDMCAELPCYVAPPPPAAHFYRSIPVLDHIAASDDDLRAAAAAIEEARTHGRVLVCCGLGFSRSATAVIAWLLMTRRATSVDSAMEMVRRARPAMRLHRPHRLALEALA